MARFESLAEAEARIAELEAQMTKRNTVSIKVSEKGAISVYGLQRFPVTLYAEQWQRLIGEVPALQSFMAKNASILTTKDGTAFVPNGANPNAGSTRNGPVTTRNHK